ncbi:helix-turn-helix transcriptional regulator [Gottfriedia acidiceleris]|uniref:WYL domain-containing protein n=1 Tax=Gottfriedia acidiceleris TaxID=371036 RepID=A0ABY4JU88_9BACI|nr:WYL domain-containing protein [Gottfriedia acidiceleris]UPM56373.1 WYL domain-containing protein [Gottfriedia acidiceleris]
MKDFRGKEECSRNDNSNNTLMDEYLSNISFFIERNLKMNSPSNIKLYIRDLLLKTNEFNPITISSIKDELKLIFNITKSDKSIRRYIEQLDEFGLDIDFKNAKHGEKHYYLIGQVQNFSTAELRLIIDAITSSKFLTKSDTTKIINRIKELAPIAERKKLENLLFVDNQVKTNNKHVKHWIETIHGCISEKLILRFKYHRFNRKKQLEFNHNGKVYEIKPYSLVWNQNYYYLIGNDKYTNQIKHFRVDRMDSVQYSNEYFQIEWFDTALYLRKTFNMYSGEVHRVKALFHHHLINVLIDYFGTELFVKQFDEEQIEITFDAAMSDGLVCWFLTWGSDAKVLEPQLLKDRLKEESIKFFNQYN